RRFNWRLRWSGDESVEGRASRPSITNSQKAGALWQKKQKHRPRMRDQAAARVGRSAVAAIAPTAAVRAVPVPAEAPVVRAKAAASTAGAKRLQVLRREDRGGQLQRCASTGAVRGGKRQDHSATPDRRVHATPAPSVESDQAGAEYRLAAVCWTRAVSSRSSLVVSRSGPS